MRGPATDLSLTIALAILSVVLVQVYYRYPIMVQLGPLGMSNMADGRRLIGSAAVFQNEPFS